MFQPRVKLEFVRRYCHPKNGWRVCVDIDPSEEGRTGSKRESAESKLRQAAMQADAPRVRESLHAIGANVGDRKHWCESSNLQYLEGDPDIVAYDPQKRRFIVAEVEGASSGQPEQKLYKAIGQIVRTASNLPSDWQGRLAIVVYGEKIANHLQRARALVKLEISGLALADDSRADRWLFGEPMLP
jgi:hypothetical protein